MAWSFSRRSFLGAGALGLPALRPFLAAADTSSANPTSDLPKPLDPYGKRSTVSLIHGDNRRKNIHDALLAIDDQIQPVLKQKKYVIIKPNNVSTVKQLAATHADALRGILDYLAPRTRIPVVIAESSAGDTMNGFENFRYPAVASEHRRQSVKLVDLNAEGSYQVVQIVDENLHPIPVRLAARLLDPDALVISAAMLKTHNVVVATLSIKNMTLGAPLHHAPKETPRWNDKRKYHGGVRQTHYGIMQTAQRMAPYWHVAVLDGFEGMEGNGPASGTPVESRIAIASTDFVAADRVGVEAMGLNPAWPGYLHYCWMAGVGQYDLGKIDVRGERLAGVVKKYQLHNDIQRELEWMGPMNELPPKLG